VQIGWSSGVNLTDVVYGLMSVAPLPQPNLSKWSLLIYLFNGSQERGRRYCRKFDPVVRFFRSGTSM